MHVFEAGLLHASDHRIFGAFRASDSVVLTKDRDFVEMVRLSGPPPRVIWVTCGNTSNRRLTVILEKTFEQALQLLMSGESLVEIKG